METEIDKLCECVQVSNGTPVLYLLKLPQVTIGDMVTPAPIYKFGITTNVNTRLRTHLRNLNFTEIIALKKCTSSADAAYLESALKRRAAEWGERKNLLGNTEIVQTCNIAKYIDLIYNLPPPAHANDGFDLDAIIREIEKTT